MGELVLIAVVWRSSHEEQMVGLFGQLRRQLIALGRIDLWTAPRAARLRAGRAFVGLINDDEIPMLLPDALTDIGLFGVVDRSDNVVVATPRIGKLLLIDRSEYDVEGFAEPSLHFIMPLN